MSALPGRQGRKVIYESPWVNLYLDAVRFPNGRVIEEYHLLDFPNAAVSAVVENAQGAVAFVQVWRYTTGRADWELPAGGLEAGETPLEAAEREVREETGFSSSDHRLMYSYYPMNGNANKRFHVVFCRAGEAVQEIDADEVSALRWFTRAEIEQGIRERAFSDGFTLTPLLLWLYG